MALTDVAPVPTRRRPARLAAGAVATADTRVRGDRAHVLFRADSDGSDDDWWGYVLERGADGRWYIVGAGVA